MRIELFDANGLNFVELNTTGDNENYVKCNQESKFVDGDVFNLFAKCFENSNKLYEYFGATRYNSRKIIPLRNELLTNLEQLNEIKTIDDFLDFAGHIFLGNNFLLELEKMDKAWEKNWDTYLMKLIEMNKEMIEIVDKCIENERILWVIGY